MHVSILGALLFLLYSLLLHTLVFSLCAHTHSHWPALESAAEALHSAIQIIAITQIRMEEEEKRQMEYEERERILCTSSEREGRREIG